MPTQVRRQEPRILLPSSGARVICYHQKEEQSKEKLYKIRQHFVTVQKPTEQHQASWSGVVFDIVL